MKLCHVVAEENFHAVQRVTPQKHIWRQEVVCGRDESSAFPFIEVSELVTDSKMPHLLCKTCDEAGKKPLLSGGA